MTTTTNSPGRGRDDRRGGHQQVLRGDQGAGRRGHERPGGDRAGPARPERAGKTTLLRILATLLAPETGRARISGVDVQQDPDTIRSLTGLAGQYPAVDETHTGRENLVMAGRLSQALAGKAHRRGGGGRTGRAGPASRLMTWRSNRRVLIA